MDTYKVKPLEEPMEVCVQVPGSKSMTNRALLLAAMGEGMTLLHGVQFSEDSLHFLTALQDLGFDVHADQEAPFGFEGLEDRSRRSRQQFMLGAREQQPGF